MSNTKHFESFVERNGYQCLTPEQKVDCYLKAYPGRTIGFVTALLLDRLDRRSALDNPQEPPLYWLEALPQIEAWVERGLAPDAYLSAIMTNNLREAVEYAPANSPPLSDLVRAIYTYLPSTCRSSPEVMRRWEALPDIDRNRICAQSPGYQEWKTRIKNSLRRAQESA